MDHALTVLALRSWNNVHLIHAAFHHGKRLCPVGNVTSGRVNCYPEVYGIRNMCGCQLDKGRAATKRFTQYTMSSDTG
jgi:hypothetical protein